METAIVSATTLWMLFFVCILTSSVLSGAGIALAAISRDSLDRLEENNIRGAALLAGIMTNKRRFNLMLLTGRIVAKTGGVLLLFVLLRQYVAGARPAGAFTILWVFVLSSLVFLFAEGVVGRLLSIGDYEHTVARFSHVLGAAYVLFFPVIFLLDSILSLFIKKSHELAAKEEALLEFLKSESEDGVIEEEEKEMIQGVLEFSDTTVREVMVPRIDVIAIDKDTPVQELIELFEREGHSRIPVYDERIDNILGVVYAKDILPIIAAKGIENFSMTTAMRKPFYVPETKKISVLLKELKRVQVHLAIVVDEYGGTAGIVALEDLLEEIVGEIHDEYDRDERDYVWINDTTVLMDAGLDIDDVNDILDTGIPNEDFDTLGGFIYHQLGVIPKGGEEFTWGNIRIHLREVIGNRISKVLIRLDEPLDGGRQTPPST